MRKSLASQKGQGLIGDLVGKGYVDMAKKGERIMYTDKLPVTSENRFETINSLPRIASKYRNVDRGFSLEKMSKRDTNYMIMPSYGQMISAEEKGMKPVVKGQV